MRRNKPSTILEQVADQAAQVFEQARDRATEFSEKIGPAVEDARDRLVPVLEDARDRIGPAVQDTRERLAPAAADAKVRLATLAEAGAVKAAAMAESAKESAREGVPTSLAERLPDSVVDTSKPSRRSRVGKVLLALGLGAAAAAVARKLQQDKEPVWHSAPVGVPSMPRQAPAAGAADTAEDTGNDDAGASPDEALADEVEAPRHATTPDEPAETVVLEDQPRI